MNDWTNATPTLNDRLKIDACKFNFRELASFVVSKMVLG